MLFIQQFDDKCACNYITTLLSRQKKKICIILTHVANILGLPYELNFSISTPQDLKMTVLIQLSLEGVKCVNALFIEWMFQTQGPAARSRHVRHVIFFGCPTEVST